MSYDYSQGKIYMIRSLLTNEIYIGSTTSTLNKRFTEHNKKSKKLSPFQKKFQELGKEYFTIELIENWPCDNVYQLTKREGYYQVLYNSVHNGLNAQYANLPNHIKQLKQKKYIENNKEIIAIKKKEYRNKNKEHIIEYNQEYRNINKDKLYESFECECGGKYTYTSKSRHLKSNKHINYIENKK